MSTVVLTDDASMSQLRHALRNRLGAICVAGDVLELSEPGSDSAKEAGAILVRQARALLHTMAQYLDDDR